jgi:hypothetical protein
MDEEGSDYLKNKLNRKTNQISFWLNTTKRFFIIYEFMKKRQVENVIHLESDCLLLKPDVVVNNFKEDNWSLSYPLQANGIGCASIFLVRGFEGISKFNNLILENWDVENQDDMQLLGQFSESKEVKILLSTPEHLNIYDPQSYGRYLLGTDARNIRFPFSRRGIIDGRVGSAALQKYKFRWDSKMNDLIVSSEGHLSHLVNIHIHSKRVPRDWKQLGEMLTQDIEKIGSRKWKRGKFDTQVFIERLFSWAGKKILRKNVDFRLR